jgi:branched-chain amino acid transport system permease protein
MWNWEFIGQQIIGGVAIGCVYGLIALGYAMTLRALGMVNFAQGELLMLGAFFGLTVLNIFPGCPYLIVVILGGLFAAICGVVAERLALRRIRQQSSPAMALTIATMALSFVLQELAKLVWGTAWVPYPESVVRTEPYTFGGLQIRPQNILIIALGWLFMVLLQLFFQRTTTGIAWRAAAQDPTTAELMGIPYDRTVSVTFALSSGLSGAAGVMIAPIVFVAFNVGRALATKGFAAMTMGGLGTITGTMLGGTALGLIETLSAAFISSTYKSIIAFAIMIIILVLFYTPKAPEARVAKGSPKQAPLSWAFPKRFAPLKTGLIVAGIAVALAFPLFTRNAYKQTVWNLAIIYSIANVGLQLIAGYTGQMSWGHAAFIGVGAYTSAILSTRFGLPVWMTAIPATILTGLISVAIAPVLRLSGIYLAMATIGLAMILELLFRNQIDLTGGTLGIMNIPSPQIGPFSFDDETRFYYLALFFLAVVCFLVYRIINSRTGRALMAIRENERAAASSGVFTTAYKIKAFVVGTMLAGFSGVLYAHFTRYISPDAFSLDFSITIVSMLVIGGMGSIPGAILGAFLVTAAPEYLRFAADFRVLIYGVVVIMFMNYLPGGLIDLINKPVRYLVTRLGWVERRELEGTTCEEE